MSDQKKNEDKKLSIKRTNLGKAGGGVGGVHVSADSVFRGGGGGDGGPKDTQNSVDPDTKNSH